MKTTAANQQQHTDLSQREISRYSRQILLPEIGQSGQQKLKQAKVLIIGCGGLGSPAALYLAAAGVGRLGLMDYDRVETSNLQRQVLYQNSDVGKHKAEAGRARLCALNPEITIDLHEEALSPANALNIFAGYDLILDGTDNFATRYLINDACVMLGKPFVYGSIYRFDGQVSVFNLDGGPCYRCLYPLPPAPDAVPSCAEAGVLGVLPGVIGSLQATEVIKIITASGQSLSGRLLIYDALQMSFNELRLAARKDCAMCGESPSIDELSSTFVCPGNNPPPGGTASLSVEELKRRLDHGDKLVLVDVREPDEAALGKLPHAMLEPLSQWQDGLVPQGLKGLPADAEIVLYCHSGNRSAVARTKLNELGFSRAGNLEGGIAAWWERIL